MATSIGRAVLELTADTAGILRGVGEIEGRMKSAAGTISTIGKTIAGAFSIAAVTGAIKSYTEFAGSITDMSAKSGIGAEALQRLKYAAEQNGGSLEMVTGAIVKMGANLVGGNKSAVGALNALGLEVDKIRGMQPDQAFTSIADAIAKVPDPMAQSKLAMDLFGKSGAELLPMMKGNLSETAAAADRLGIVMSESAVAAGDRFGDQMDTLMLVGRSVIAQFLEPMIPALTMVAQWLGDFVPAAIKAARGGFDFLIEKGLEVVLFLKETALRVTELGNKVPWLGAKLGASTENVEALRASVALSRDTLKAFTTTTEATGRVQESTARTVGRLNLNYAEQESAAKKAARATEQLEKAQERFASSVKSINTLGFWVPLHKSALMIESDVGRLIELESRTIQETARLNDEMQEWARTNGAIVPTVKAISTTLATEVPTWRRTFTDTFTALPQIIMGAIQGGGSVLGAVGAHIGTSVMSRFQTTFGPAIEAALPFGIGKAVTALLPMLGSLFGPVLSKIGGFFRNLFGGPDAEELAGRRLVAEFEGNIQRVISNTQAVEAGNESWRRTVVVVRDAYLAMGRTEAEALAAVERLWRSSKQGAGAVEAAMQPIQEALDFINQQAGTTTEGLEELGATGMEAAQRIRSEFENLSIRVPVDFDVRMPNFRDFDMPAIPMAEGGAGRVSSPTLFLAGEEGPEDFAFSGANRRFGGGGDMSGVEARLAQLERTLTNVLPALVSTAVKHVAQTSGRRR